MAFCSDLAPRSQDTMAAIKAKHATVYRTELGTESISFESHAAKMRTKQPTNTTMARRREHSRTAKSNSSIPITSSLKRYDANLSAWDSPSQTPPRISTKLNKHTVSPRKSPSSSAHTARNNFSYDREQGSLLGTTTLSIRALASLADCCRD